MRDMDKNQMVEYEWYKIRHRAQGQRYDRKSVMQYLGVDPYSIDAGRTIHMWNARPTAGTQGMLDSDIISVEKVDKPDKPFIGARW